MFEQTFLAGVRTRRAWTVPVCFLGQVAVVGGLVLLPLVFFEGLPQGRLTPPPLTTPLPRPIQSVELVPTPHRATIRPAFVMPTRVPIGVSRVVDT
jgi:hypothetical protein